MNPAIDAQTNAKAMPQQTLSDNLNHLVDSNSPAPAAVKKQVKVKEKVKVSPAKLSPSIKVKPPKVAKKDTKSPISSGAPFKSVKGMKNLIDALLAKGIITSGQTKHIKLTLATQGKDLESYLLSKQYVEDVELAKVKSEMYAIPYMNISEEEIDKDILNLIPSEAAQKNEAVAYGLTDDGRVKLAMREPLDMQKVRYLETLMGKKAQTFFAARSGIEQVINTQYGAQLDSEVSEALEDIEQDVVELSAISKVEDLSMDLARAPVSKMVNMMLEYAIKYKASDIHIEPREKKISVRFRIYGVMSEKLTIPRKLGSSIVSRIKILSNLKIDEKRVPQDGRFQVKSGESLIDLRVSVMPTVYGEKVVLRLLEKGGGSMELKDTGLRGPALKIYTESLSKTQGIILITGPTGSGKTQTLASSLKVLNKPDVNIITIEDPVEIRVDGVTQVQVNKAVELTFAKALKSFLRQDPDIIMVGEIRDSETANLATQAALTGHLVLSTLHTNSAAGALPRMLDMGVESFLIASTINVVVAQRLTRRICDECKVTYKAPIEMIKEIHKVLSGLKGLDLYSYPKNEAKELESIEDDVIYLYKGKGCPKCNNSGYRGRVGIFECMMVTPKIGQLIMQERSADEVEKQAVEEGMISMKQDGYMKALEGITTIGEILRVVN